MADTTIEGVVAEFRFLPRRSLLPAYSSCLQQTASGFRQNSSEVRFSLKPDGTNQCQLRTTKPTKDHAQPKANPSQIHLNAKPRKTGLFATRGLIRPEQRREFEEFHRQLQTELDPAGLLEQALASIPRKSSPRGLIEIAR